jgi:hypothetical protein
MRSVRAAALAAGIGLAGAAGAVPPDARLTLQPGSEKFLRAPVDLVDVVAEPAGVVSAEVLPSKEIFVTVPPAATGAATLIAVGSDRLYAWDVCVGRCPAETNIAAARSACPTLAQVTEDGQPLWTATVKDVRCLDALRNALSHATIPLKQLRFNLEENVAVEFFRRVEKAISDDPATHGLVASYYGATLKLSGEVPRSAVTRAVVHAWFETIGSVSFDDQTTQPGSTTATASESAK